MGSLNAMGWPLGDWDLRFLTLVVTLAGFIGLTYQIVLHRRETRARLLLELDRDSNDFVDVRNALSDPTLFSAQTYRGLTEQERTRLHGYLALYERIEICLESGAVDERSIRRLFGLRMKILFAHAIEKEILSGPHRDHFELVIALRERMNLA